ncbi:MAG: cytochrome c3 family protein [Acidobacteria bacterium]|nr:cytochrome c3 family protein [Acidobacteriota bacterium]
MCMMRLLPLFAFLFLPNLAMAQPSGYAGSIQCKACHLDTYQRWSKTRMANVIADPKQHPEAVIPDFSKPDPLLTFKLEDVALTYGSKWKQRYFKKVGDDFFPFPAQWDVANKVWRAYNVKPGTDWWTAHYGADNMQRPTGPLCDGCHSVNYNVQTKTVTEWNVGCEKCHGPGLTHTENPSRANIVNPARLSSNRANDVCIQCHSQGKPLNNPIAGKHFDWPAGFDVTKNLGDFWELEEHKPGETTFTHFADGTAHKNRMQGNDFVQSSMYTHGVTCSSCHDPHGSPNNADLLKPASAVCLTCHGPSSPNGPRTATIEQHTHHKSGSSGNECISCHMPKIEQTIADVNVRSHTFKFIPPVMTERFKIPNPCTTCHTGKTTSWAKDELKKWPEVSHWRVAGK